MVEGNLILSIILMLIASAFFSGMEIAFVSANKLRIELEKKQNTFVSRLVTIFAKNPSLFISTMLVGNNIALVIYGISMTKYIEPIIRSYISSEIGVLLVNTVVSTFIILITAEFLPKVLFKLRPNTILNIFSVPVFFFYVLFYPITRFTIWLSRFFISNILNNDFREFDDSYVFGKVDLNNLIQEHSIDDKTEEKDNEIRLFRNALDFSDVKLRECLIPRTEIVAVSLETSIEDLRTMFTESGFSRILVYEESIDNIIAYVHSSVLFKKPKKVSDCLSSLIVVPETMQAQKLLKLFTKKHKSIALVVDEFGGTSGVVTIEDIMEEIFGEIEDEHDNVLYVEKQISETEFHLSGRLEIDYVNEKFKLDLPESEEYETIAGWILYNYQDLPTENQEIKIGSYLIRISKIVDARIDLVYITRK